jgi:hypothetical protein
MPVIRHCAFALIPIIGSLASPSLQAAPQPEPPQVTPGERSDIWVGTDKTVSDLLADGYDLKVYNGPHDQDLANLFILQKGASLFSCFSTGHLGSVRTWCEELKEQK